MTLSTLFRPNVLTALGRAVLASLFMLGGLNKIIDYNDTLAVMRGAGLEPATLLLPLTILLELGGGALIALGRRFVAPAALTLAVFTFATNLVFHRFWSMNGTEGMLQLSLFFKNVSVAGGLLVIAGIAAQRNAQ
jgi:putative oxidoreductase